MSKNKLTLDPQGQGGCLPDQEPWKPGKKRAVTIVNASGADQQLNKISKGLLNAAPGDKIDIAAGTTWSGTVGNKKGTYEYDDGSKKRGLRTGTIDPS